MSQADDKVVATGAFAVLARWNGALLAVLLIVVASAQAGGAVSAFVGHGLSGLLILAGVVWAMIGSDRLRRLSELYLWLAMILALSLLQVVAAGIAERLGEEWIVVFRPIGTAHLVLVALALWQLGAWTPDRRVARGPSDLARRGAGFLIFGAVVFWVGARTFPGTALEGVAAELDGHLWTSAGFLIATLLTLVGLGFLTRALRAAGDGLPSIFGLCTYAFGAVFWILHLMFRLTVMKTAAEEFAETGSAPVWYVPWVDWSGLLFGFYSVLAYLAIVAYGVAILKSGLLPRWVAWVCILFGVLQAPMVGPPFFIHVGLWFVGLLILQPKD